MHPSLAVMLCRAALAMLAKRRYHLLAEVPTAGEHGGSDRRDTPEEADRHVAAEIDKWRRLVAERRIEVQ